MPSKLELPSEKVQRNLLEIVEHFEEEDRVVYERQIRKCRRLKLYWDNIFQAYWSEVAHDWRVWDQNSEDNSNQAYYDKPVNTFKAYIETIIAALSVTTPAVKCYPEDAESSLDTVTAKAGDKIAQLLSRHNNYQLLWLKALYTYYTEGTVYCYSYPRYDERYGTYETKQYEQEMKTQNVVRCATCKQETEVDGTQNQFQPEEQIKDFCPACGQLSELTAETKSFVVDKIVGVTKNPKARVCLEVYGGLYVKIANYAKTPEQTPYLRLATETHFANAIEEFEHLADKDFKKKLANESGGVNDVYAQWGRLNTLYMGEQPNYVVTIRKFWLRPAAYNYLGDADQVKELKQLYPRGVKVCLVNDEFASAEPQALDDYWTISVNPTEDYLTHDAAGTVLVNTQEITNDMISLVLQTAEAGIGQTFADPGVLNFKAYSQTESTPGGLYEAVPKSGKSVSDAFYQLKTATLSAEIMPFFDLIQGLAQLVSGALPSLFGGELSENKTASGYSMSRAQALQRIQNIWKLFTSWWKEIQGKAIPIYINNMKDDEKDVQKLSDGSFINVFIRLAELQGKIGKVELEAADNLPLTWTQVKDTIMKMFEMQTPAFLAMLQAPENIPILRDAIGLNNFYIPGEDDRSKQNDEIRELLESEPIESIEGDEMGMPMPSVEVDPIYDNHAIHFEIVRQWAVSEAGRLAKIENEPGYQNVLLHGQMHQMIQQQQMMEQQMAAQNNPEKPKDSRKVSGEEDVPVNA